jgi:hypothetical protein
MPDLRTCFHHQHNTATAQASNFKSFSHKQPQPSPTPPQQPKPPQPLQLQSSNSNLRNGCHRFLRHQLHRQLWPLWLQQVSISREESAPGRVLTPGFRGNSEDDEEENKLRDYGRSGYNK